LAFRSPRHHLLAWETKAEETISHAGDRPMILPYPGAIDCDVHPAVPSMAALLPYLSEHWREQVLQRGIEEQESAAYPPNAPLSARPDWRPEHGHAGSDPARLGREALDRFGSSLAICNCLYGVQLPFSEDLAAALARAVNDWMAHEWLDRDPRLRASIVVPPQSPELAVEEIERCAGDPRFVQVLLLAMSDMPLGRRQYWPIYAAAERHRLTVGIHAGGSYHNPPTAIGWPTYLTEDTVGQAQSFQSQLTSLVCEGVFSRFPGLRVVLLESGFTWLPAHLWRLSKSWRGLRAEVPWVDRSPTEIVRDHVRLTLQPVDAPPTPDAFSRLLDHLGSESLLLFSTDYPHWQFDGDAVLPEGLPDRLVRKILLDNPRETYPRLLETVP
jgi:uncharacterized protein